MMRVMALVMACLVTVSATATAQRETSYDSAYADVKIPRIPLRWIIETPTAGMLPRGAFDLDFRTFSGGGLQGQLDIGLMSRFSVGLSYNAATVFSDVTPEWGPRLEFQLRLRILEEGHGLPAVAVGYSSQGFGPYDAEHSRYQIKSPGFYTVVSTNFLLYSYNAGFHAGINYSLENDIDDDPSGFIGFNSDLGYDMTFLAEYNLAINDNTNEYSLYGRGRGYLNMGLVWYITDGLSLELDLKNLLKNRAGAGSIDREARLVYVEFFY